MKKDYRKKESLMVVVFILGILLLLAGCPNTTNPKPDPCPGNCFECNGYGKCGHIDCHCPKPVPMTFKWNGSLMEMVEYPPSGAPSWVTLTGASSFNTHVKKNGDTIYIDNSKTASAIIFTTTAENGNHYGCIFNSSVNTGSYPVTNKATSFTSPYEVYSNNGGTWFKVGLGYYIPPDPTAPTHDFTTTTDATTLFGSFLDGKPTSAYATGTDVINLMKARWGNANPLSPSGTMFYPISHYGVNQVGTGIASGVTVKKTLIYSGDPYMGFIIPSGSSDLFIWGEATGGGTPQKINFWIAVIRESDGKGWLTEHSRSYTYSPSTAKWDKDITLSSLTKTRITNQSQLGSDYFVYIVVKSTTDLIATNGSNSDMNNNVMSDCNVIQVYPQPYSIP